MARAAAAEPERRTYIWNLNESPEQREDREMFEDALRERDERKERERLEREQYDADRRERAMHDPRVGGL